MIQFVTAPSWFSGYDIILDAISVFVLLLVFFAAIKIYRFNKEKKYLMFGFSFLLLAFSEIGKIIRSEQVYYDVFHTKTIAGTTISSVLPFQSSTMIFIGNFLHYAVFLLGLLGLFYIYQKPHDRRPWYLMIFFIIIIALYSTELYFIFHLTAAILLFFLFEHATDNYKKNKTKSTLLITIAFLALLISRIFFMFVSLNDKAYVIAEIVQLIGFLAILIFYIGLNMKNRQIAIAEKNNYNNNQKKVKKNSKNDKKIKN